MTNEILCRSIPFMLLMACYLLSLLSTAESQTINRCSNNKPVQDGNTFVFRCVVDNRHEKKRINYARVQHGNEVCNFKVFDYKMKADQICDTKLKSRIRVTQSDYRYDIKFELRNVQKEGEQKLYY